MQEPCIAVLEMNTASVGTDQYYLYPWDSRQAASMQAASRHAFCITTCTLPCPDMLCYECMCLVLHCHNARQSASLRHLHSFMQRTQFVKYAVCCNAVMQAAASRVTAAGTQGSSTCCIVLVDTLHGRLASANVGDSGFMILGVTHNNPKPHVKFRTPQQEHQFGCPYQLGHHQAADPPEEAMLTALPVSLSVDPAL